jgi:hypothetical protein
MTTDVTEIIRFGEGLFWASRMAGFSEWGNWFVDMSATGATGHAASVLEFAEENGIGGDA